MNFKKQTFSSSVADPLKVPIGDIKAYSESESSIISVIDHIFPRGE
jgi:hypothetical protein